jgi:hypothetical protein
MFAAGAPVTSPMPSAGRQPPRIPWRHDGTRTADSVGPATGAPCSLTLW